MTITLDDVKSWRRQLVLHARLQSGSYFEYRALENPRLRTTYLRKGHDTVKRIFVDDVEITSGVPGLLAALNRPRAAGDLLQHLPHELAQEAQWEADKRQGFYPTTKDFEKNSGRITLLRKLSLMQEIARIMRRMAEHQPDPEDMFAPLPRDFGEM
jgi:hypothetical protein